MARGILLTLLLVSCLYVTYGFLRNIKHNLVLGRRGPTDVILYRKTINKSNWNPLSYTAVDVTFPVKKKTRRKPIITEINALDLYGYDKGGHVSILKGGVGRNNVTIRFKSQKAHGFKFILTIYGHY